MAAALALAGTGDVRTAVRAAAWAARDLNLLPPAELERVFGRTVEGMTRQDLAALAGAARRLARMLDRESGRRP
jgi:hypothetical protein